MDDIENGIKELTNKVNPASKDNPKNIISSILYSSTQVKAIEGLICWGLGVTTIPISIYPLLHFYSCQYPYIKQFLEFYFRGSNQN